ncbi:MAG: hypothetical protein AMK73_04170 [Planctomycetes bacterium SM23_32]|nr:MAG: hypothetical protein AMK73_04170 [Planctomycetes bacterium SM23_32]
MAGRRSQEDYRREPPWYEDGLRFTCTQCCQCCTGPPGYVWLSSGELGRIARFFGLSPAAFARQYCREVGRRVSLKEQTNGDCVLLTPAGCGVYPVRPAQCRTFPFWRDNIRSRQSWEAAAERCPGIGRGRLYAWQEIERIAAERWYT